MARSEIRSLLQEDYDRLCEEGGYKAVAKRWGLSDSMVWRIINEGYWPADEKIREQLIYVARQRGLTIRKRGRKQDLFSMDPAELRERLENRVLIKRRAG